MKIDPVVAPPLLEPDAPLLEPEPLPLLDPALPLLEPEPLPLEPPDPPPDEPEPPESCPPSVAPPPLEEPDDPPQAATQSKMIRSQRHPRRPFMSVTRAVYVRARRYLPG